MMSPFVTACMDFEFNMPKVGVPTIEISVRSTNIQAGGSLSRDAAFNINRVKVRRVEGC